MRMQNLSAAYYSRRLPAFFACFALLSAFLYSAFASTPWLAFYSFAAALALVPLFDEYREARRVQDLERNLPPALFRMSSLSAGAPFESLVDIAASSGLGEAGRAFSRVRSLLRAGFPARQALLDVAGEYDSQAFRRTAALLASLHGAGGGLSAAVHRIAEDAFELQQLSQENAALLSVQKYTLLAASAVIVPFIFASLLQASYSLAQASPSAASEAILPSFALAAQVYLVAFACLSGCLVAMQEGNIKKAVAYSCLVAPLSLLVFRAAGGAWVFA